MQLGKILTASIVTGIVANVFDYLVHGVLLAGPVYSHFSIFRSDTPISLFIATDFVAAFVLVWVYDRVRASFAPGVKGGALFGFYAGVLMSFPTWIGSYLIIAGFTYGLAWIWTLTGVLWAVLGGAVAGWVYSRAGARAPA